MYQLLIVDDESSIRQGIANSIPWGEWGYEVAGLCADGVEAVKVIDACKPDVVLSDIRMPNMDGVELMQYLNAHYPEIKIVILSGYSDFEYLNMSIKNSVTEYLLKPTDVDEFEALFHRLRAKMDEERTLRQEYQESVSRHFSDWVEALLKGHALAQDTERFLPVLAQEGVSPENVIVVSLQMDERAGDEAQSVYALRNRILQLCTEHAPKGHALYLLVGDRRIVGLHSGPEEEAVGVDAVMTHVRSLQKNIRRTTGATVSAGVSNLCTEQDMLPQAYEQANCCAGQSLFYGNESLFAFSSFFTEKSEGVAHFHTELIEKAMLAKDYDTMATELERVFVTFTGGAVRDYRVVDRACISLLFTVSVWGLQYNLYMEDILKSLGTTYTDVYRCDTLGKKKEFLLGVLFAAQNELSERRIHTRGAGTVAQRIREFVDREFCENAMSLEYVAGHVHRNTAYISRVFKNELGCNFSDYLTEKRMRRAMELLQNPDCKVYEAARLCGYADTSNFIKVFRKTQGVSPNEYRGAGSVSHEA